MRFLALLFATLVFTACSSLPITKHESKGQNARIQSLILHFTASNYKKSMFTLKESGAVSSHYLVPRSDDESYPKTNLEIIQLVDESQRAWHAGHSYWQGRDNLNDTSIGIEIVNEPKCKEPTINRRFFGGEYGNYRQCHFSEFQPEQIELVIKLAQDILLRHPEIDPTRVVGHSDISPSRKNDPGPTFPWFQLYQHGVGAWYEQETFEHYQHMFKQYFPSVALIQKALKYYGYRIAVTGELDKQSQHVIQAFKHHFLPEEALFSNKSALLKQTGLTQIDESETAQQPELLSIKTVAAIFALIDRYKEQLLKPLLKQYNNDMDLAFSFDKQSTQQNTTAITKRTLIFNAVTGDSKVTLTPALLQPLPELNIYLNGRYISQDFASVNNNQLKIDVGRWTRNGKNIVQVTSQFDISDIKIEVTGTQLLVSQQSSNVLNELDTLAQNASLNGNISVAHLGQILKKKDYGKAPSSFVLSDNSALFTTYLALFVLASEQGISVNDLVAEHVPEYRSLGSKDRRIQHLLSHTSGYGDADIPADEKIQKENKKAQQRKYVLEQLPFHYSLNTYYGSDINTFILNQMIEYLTNMPLQQYLSNHVWQTLGLTHTKLIVDDSSFEQATSPFMLPRLRTTEDELLVLMQLLLNRGRYGEVQLFDESDIYSWFLTLNTMPNNKLAGDSLTATSTMNCVPYLSDSSLVIASSNGQLILLDHEFQLLVLLATANNQTLDTTRFSCGMSLFHQGVLNFVYQQIYQNKM